MVGIIKWSFIIIFILQFGASKNQVFAKENIVSKSKISQSETEHKKTFRKMMSSSMEVIRLSFKGFRAIIYITEYDGKLSDENKNLLLKAIHAIERVYDRNHKSRIYGSKKMEETHKLFLDFFYDCKSISNEVKNSINKPGKINFDQVTILLDQANKKIKSVMNISNPYLNSNEI